MFAKILLGLAVIVGGLCAFIATRPDTFRVTRTRTIAAPAAAVFANVNNLHAWQNWSPWAKVDPNAKASFSGPAEGVGAAFAWDGNMEVGKGQMTITESHPNERVNFDLVFEKPMAGSNVVEFVLVPQGENTQVTWTMSGKANFISKAMGLVMDCDKMCGDQFEKGLSQLETVSKTAAPAQLTSAGK